MNPSGPTGELLDMRCRAFLRPVMDDPGYQKKEKDAQNNVYSGKAHRSEYGFTCGHVGGGPCRGFHQPIHKPGLTAHF